MVRRLLRYLGFVILGGTALVGIFLGRAHWQIRQIDTPLPAANTLKSLIQVRNTPQYISFINTASQRIGADTTVAYPAFRLEWADGKTFLIDAGMDREGAIEFGRSLERLTNADPIQTHGSVGEQLGDRDAAIRGMAFTHLHLDHVGGLTSLCFSDGNRIPVYQTPWQAERHNYTTVDGRDMINDSSCVETIALAGDGALYAIPEFPGVAAFAAGGHTPGTTVFFAALDDTIWVLAGDITNKKKSIGDNLPKPALYSLFVTPEDGGRLAALRTWLAALDRDPAFSVVVSHDLEALEASGIEAWAVTAGNP